MYLEKKKIKHSIKENERKRRKNRDGAGGSLQRRLEKLVILLFSLKERPQCRERRTLVYYIRDVH